jgi:hypothetical protein
MNINPAPFVLASILTSYPMDYIPENITVLLEDKNVDLPEDLRSLILKKHPLKT